MEKLVRINVIIIVNVLFACIIARFFHLCQPLICIFSKKLFPCGFHLRRHKKTGLFGPAEEMKRVLRGNPAGSGTVSGSCPGR